jgi:hypothetical protein
MINAEDSWYDGQIRKVSKGTFEYVSSETAPATEEPEDDDNEDASGANTDRIVRVPAFGLYWDKSKVRWNSGELLGRGPGSSNRVDFADQHGVYILYKDRSVAYVGRTIDSLYGRLRAHNRDNKSVRWDRFSWFGFREVADNGQLNAMPPDVDPAHLVSILESVLIEALEPPVNGRRGDFLGLQYEQVPDPIIAQQQSKAFLQSLTG